MNFLQVNITFYDAVNIMHHVIITRNPYPYTDKFVFLDVTFDKDQQIRCWRIYRICKCTYCCRISKISNSVWKLMIVSPRLGKLSILPTSLDISDIRQD